MWSASYTQLIMLNDRLVNPYGKRARRMPGVTYLPVMNKMVCIYCLTLKTEIIFSALINPGLLVNQGIGAEIFLNWVRAVASVIFPTGYFRNC